MKSWEQYAAAFEAKRNNAEEKLAASNLPLLEDTALAAACIAEERAASLPASDIGTAIASTLAKLTNEMLAFSGAVRMGALHGAYHHTRAVLELRAILHYLFADQMKSHLRAAQFVEFGEMAAWARRRRLEFDVEDQRITKEEFDRRNIVTDHQVRHATPERIDYWKTIFGAKSERRLVKRRTWHDGSLKSLFEALDPTGKTYFQYELMCHPTHVSPIGHRLSAGSTPRLFGYRGAALNVAVDFMLGHCWRALAVVSEQLDGALDDLLIASGVALQHAG